MQILEVIRTEILINRGMEDRQEVMENITRLNQLIDDEMDKPTDMQDTQAIASFQTQLGALMASKMLILTNMKSFSRRKSAFSRI